jgi:predicted 3-demethylubiquinone-9 3-methyltransferase (glyoxalase superfamily)
MHSITPFLWFKKDAQKAAKFYVSIFKSKSKVIDSNPMVTTLQLLGQELMILNGGPMFKLNTAFSFFISVKTQKDIDYYTRKLTAGGGYLEQCGWLVDKYGLSWQVIPEALMTYLGHSDRVKADRATQAMLKMKKLDLAALKRAFDGP